MTSTSDSFVPIVSSSPPPIDFGSSEDEDDEFGTFSAAKVEFDSPPGKSSSNPLGNKHFFPIDVPHEDQDDNFQLSQSKPREDVLPVSTTSLGKLNINDGDDDTRTSTQIPNYQKFQASTKLDQPLPNGILHPGSLHDSSESLEFKQNEDNVHIKNGNFLQESNCHSIKSSVDKRKEDFKEDFKQFDTGENLHHELDDGEASSQSMKSDLEDQSGSNWAAFDTFHEKTDDSPGPVTEPKTDISSTSSSHENLPHNSEMKLEYLRNRDEDKRDASGFSVQQSIDKELPSEPLGMPSVAMENDGDGDDDDEFGDFGSSIKDDQSNSVNTPETDFKSEFERIDTNDDFGDFGSFESKPVTGIFNQESGHSKETFHNPTVITGSDSCVSEKGESLKLENLPKGSNDDDFDDDDFAEFSAFKRDSSESAKADEGTSQPTESQDNFGEFGAFKTESNTTDSTNGSDWANFGGSGSSSRTVDDNFGNFDSFKVSSSNLKDGFDGDDDDDFASFESSRASSVSVGGSLRINQVFNGCFPNSINKAYPALTISLQPLSGLICQSKDSPSGAYGTNGSGLQLSTKSTNGLGVWSVLSDMENTKAMGYQWTKSDSKKKLLSSLGLDERNILTSRVGGVPKFASDLGMLQPIKPGEPPLQAEAAPRQEEAFPPEESVPKVEFDWSGSGLINPLDAPSIDPDILNLEAPSDPSPALAPSKPTFKPLDEILKTSSMSMVQQPLKRESNLSDEANKTLDSLPDLSFMLAKVLMFPIKSQSASEVQQIGGTLGGGSLLD